MSLSDKITRRASLAFALAAPLFVGGCFQPMYGGASGALLTSELRGIKVEPIPERIGHYLSNELRFALSGGEEDPNARYRLVVSLRQRIQAPLVDTVSGRATSGMLIVDADYRLVPIAGGEAILSGVAFGTASYDRTSNRFSNLRAARDAEIRSAKTLADQIRTRVSAALAQRA